MLFALILMRKDRFLILNRLFFMQQVHWLLSMKYNEKRHLIKYKVALDNKQN